MTAPPERAAVVNLIEQLRTVLGDEDSQALRLIVNEHLPWTGPRGHGDPPGPMCSTCVSMVMDEDRGGNIFRDVEHLEWPCPTLRLLVVHAQLPHPPW